MVNRQLEPENSPQRVTTRIFNSVVRIQFDPRVEREIFDRRPARRILRRHSMNVHSAIIVLNDGGSEDQSSFELHSMSMVAEAGIQESTDAQPTSSSQIVPLRQKRRLQSVDSAVHRYIGPDDLRSTIKNLRRTLGK